MPSELGQKVAIQGKVRSEQDPFFSRTFGQDNHQNLTKKHQICSMISLTFPYAFIPTLPGCTLDLTKLRVPSSPAVMKLCKLVRLWKMTMHNSRLSTGAVRGYVVCTVDAMTERPVTAMCSILSVRAESRDLVLELELLLPFPSSGAFQSPYRLARCRELWLLHRGVIARDHPTISLDHSVDSMEDHDSSPSAVFGTRIPRFANLANSEYQLTIGE